MSRTRGRRYDTEPKLNIKKVFATIIAIVVFVMFVISLKNLLTEGAKPQEVSTVTTYFSVFTITYMASHGTFEESWHSSVWSDAVRYLSVLNV